MNADGDKRRGSDLSDFIRGRIFSLKFDAGWSYQEIGDKLSMSRNTIAKCCQRFDNDAPEKNGRSSCGSSKVTTERDERHMVRVSQSDRFMTASQIQRAHFPNISVHTVRRRLSENGLKAYSPAKKPVLNERLRALRHRWAYDHLAWTLENWSCLAFSDESSFCLSQNGTQYVRRRIGERYEDACVLSHENRSKGSCMVWGAFSLADFTPLYRVEGGTLNSERYIHLLQHALLPFLPMLLPTGGNFQQDNAPAHASKATKKFFDDHAIPVFPWPSTSPDMNPIENVWGNMANILNRNYETPKDADQLFSTLEEIWCELMEDVAYRRKLVESMTDRVCALNASSGGFTRY